MHFPIHTVKIVFIIHDPRLESSAAGVVLYTKRIAPYQAFNWPIVIIEA
jgi:hypothetical protein